MRCFRYGMCAAASLVAAFMLAASAGRAAEPAKTPSPGKPAATTPAPGLKVPAAGVPPSPGVPVPEGPRIREFSGPAQWVPGEPMPFRLAWDAEPGVGGSAVSYVGIWQGDRVVASPLPASGSHEARPVSYPAGAASLEYTLKALDMAGKISSRTLSIRLLSVQQALRQLEVGLEAEPREFRSGMPVQLKVNFRSGHWPMSGMEIRVSHAGRTVGNLSSFAIRGPVSAANLRDDGFPGTSGEYVVEIEYLGQTIQKRFSTYGIPYYSLVPASR